MDTKKFHIGDVLSITTGKLVSPRHMDGIYDILNFMTGDNLFTHQLPRASEECKPEILMRHPELADVDTSNVNGENWKEWIQEQVERFGEYLEISTLVVNLHEFKDPVEELEEMVDDPSKIIKVELPDEDDKEPPICLN